MNLNQKDDYPADSCAFSPVAFFALFLLEELKCNQYMT